jgi:phosphopantothenoylcysteine decarboxylase/phosphopantothenate--cysteine ligase
LRILLGVTGGIAAYKAANLIRAFAELGHDVEVVPTQNALRFIGLPTLESLSGKKIDIDMYHDVAEVRHVELGAQADLIVIAPATAAFMARLAAGIADDLLMNAILASTAKVVICPAMHTEMWLNPATVANTKTLMSRGVSIMPPASGRLTGKDSGPGRLPETHEIIDFVFRDQPLTGKRVTITAGGTREPIDQVRFIGNASSGKMGIELATQARDLGAVVTLIACNLEVVLPKGVKVIHAGTVLDLRAAMQDASCDVLIMAAAVSDFQLAKPHEGKLARSNGLSLELIPTVDLVKEFATEHPETFTVGFALADAADQELIDISRRKLNDKGLSVVIGNSLASLGSDDTQLHYVSKSDSQFLSGSKKQIALEIINRVAESI